MKKIIYSLVLIVLGTFTANARDNVALTRLAINPGQTRTVELMLNNDTSYCALQTDIILPQGLHIATDDDELIIDGTQRLSSNHGITSNTLSSGAVRVMVVSQNSYSIRGNDGAVLTIDFVADDTFEKGDIVLTNNILIEVNGQRHTLEESICKVNDYIMGDVNYDGNIDIADVVKMAGHVMGEIYEDFYAICADMNDTGDINVADVVTLARLVLGN